MDIHKLEVLLGDAKEGNRSHTKYFARGLGAEHGSTSKLVVPSDKQVAPKLLLKAGPFVGSFNLTATCARQIRD